MSETRRKSVFYAGTSASVREQLDDILVPQGIELRAFTSIDDCRESLVRDHYALLVVELNGDAPRGLQSLAELTNGHPHVPVLAIVDRGDIPTTIQAMRAGAANCLEKPVTLESLAPAMNELFDQMEARFDGSAVPLTAMETTVLQHILEGRTNRQIADALYRSPRTIEVHRRHIMCKLGASTIVDLVRAVGLKGPA